MAFDALNETDSVLTGDGFVLWKQGASKYRLVASDVVLAWAQSNLGSLSKPETLYAAPSASGFTVATSPTTDGDDTHLILTPTAGYAAGTITLPISTSLVDKQEVLVNCTQQVTALTVNGNGASAVTGEPTSLAADDFFRMQYDALTSTWYRIG